MLSTLLQSTTLPIPLEKPTIHTKYRHTYRQTYMQTLSSAAMYLDEYNNVLLVLGEVEFETHGRLPMYRRWPTFGSIDIQKSSRVSRPQITYHGTVVLRMYVFSVVDE